MRSTTTIRAAALVAALLPAAAGGQMMVAIPAAGAGVGPAAQHAPSGQSSANGERIIRFTAPIERSVCIGDDSSLDADPGYGHYAWYGGPDLAEIRDVGGRPTSGGAPLPVIDASGSKKSLFYVDLENDTYVYLRQSLTASSAPSYKKFKVKTLEELEVTIEGPAEVERGAPVALKTKESFTTYRWRFEGRKQRPEKAFELKRKKGAKWNKKGWTELVDAVYRCLEVEMDGTLNDCEKKVGESYSKVEETMTFVQSTVRKSIVDRELGRASIATHHPLLGTPVYSVQVTDANGCKGAALYEVEVDQHTVDLVAGVEFARTATNSASSSNSASWKEPPGTEAETETETETET